MITQKPEDKSTGPISELVEVDFDLSYPTYLKDIATEKIKEFLLILLIFKKSFNDKEKS